MLKFRDRSGKIKFILADEGSEPVPNTGALKALLEAMGYQVLDELEESVQPEPEGNSQDDKEHLLKKV